MPEETDIQNLIATAWAAGYAARETELICRRHSSPAQRAAEIAKVTKTIMGSLQETSRAPVLQERAVAH